MRNSSSLTAKQLPQRTCLACRQVKAKSEMVRLVRVADGSVEVDIDGKKKGRGAYLCPLAGCWKTGLKGNRLEHTLRVILTQDNRERLIKYGKDLYEGVD